MNPPAPMAVTGQTPRVSATASGPDHEVSKPVIVASPPATV